jgi:uncharacterized protein
MELNGEVTIAAPRDRVWAALNDPDMLARCIDGVESLARVAGADGERFEGKMNARVGPVRASFTGQVTLMDVVAPESYRLVGEGKGGVAGHARGEAAVTLAEPAPGTTLLAYKVTSSVGGKLAQLGARLIEGAAKGYAESFFAKLKAEVEAPAAESAMTPVVPPAPATASAEAPLAEPADAHAPAAASPPPAGPADTSSGLSPLVWGGGLVLAVLAFLAWQWL